MVFGIIKKLKSEGKVEEAKQIETKLEASIDGAHQLAVQKGHIDAPKPAQRTQPASAPSDITRHESAPRGDQSASASEPAESKPKAVVPAVIQQKPKELDSDVATEHADEVLKFLRSKAALLLSTAQKQGWTRVFAELETCRLRLGITLLKSHGRTGR
jgi:hypothetical protein